MPFNSIYTSDLMDALEQGKSEIMDEMEDVGVGKLSKAMPSLEIWCGQHQRRTLNTSFLC